MQLSHNFHLSEFDCPCSYADCTETKVHDELVFLLQRLRDWLLQRIYITSAYRCEKHEADLKNGGHPVAEHSQHRLGFAADIWTQGMNSYQLETEVRHVGFLAVGVSSTNWVHVDLRKDKRRRWTYS